MATHGEKANSGHSSGHFWNYVNVLCKKGLQGKKENPCDKGMFMQVSEVMSSKWSLPMESGCSLQAKLKLNTMPSPAHTVLQPTIPREVVLRKAAKVF